MNSNFPYEEVENAKVNMFLLRESSWHFFSFQFNIRFSEWQKNFFILKRILDCKKQSGVTLELYSVKQKKICKNELKADLKFINA